MATKIQMRRDTAANWASANPVLMEGELGFVTDNPNQYKMGDGEHAWNDLPMRGFDGNIVGATGNSTTSVMSQKAVTDELDKKAPATTVSEILRDLGKYGTLLSLTMSVAKSGKYVDSNGEEVSSSTMGISAPMAFKAGNIYLFPASAAVGIGVSLFSRQVTRTYNKVLSYTYTYDTDGKILTATADYDTSLVYTYTYDAEGTLQKITDKDGSTVANIPATYEVTESFYEPLFRTNDETMPKSGYYLFLCTTDMDVVVSAKSSDITGKTLLGVRYGAFATIATNFVGTPGQKVLAQAFAELYALVQTLQGLADNAGNMKMENLDIANFPKICGTVMYSTGEGAPAVPPAVPFQEYYDIEGNKFYKAKGALGDNPTVGDWIAIN